MATKRPVKPGAAPEPENPRAAPGQFIIRGKAWFNEEGEMVLDEDGEVPDDIEEELVERGNFLYRVRAYRINDRVPPGTPPMYELKWCPVPVKKRETKANSRKR